MVSKVSTTSETARTAPAAGEIPRWHILEGEATSSSSTSSTTVSGSTASASTSAASSTTIGPTTASTSASITSGATESSTSSFSTVSGSTKVSTTPASTVSGATVPLSTLGSVSTIRISSTLAPTTTTEVPCTNETLPTLFIAISCTIGVQQVDAFAEGAVNVDTARLADSYSKYQLVIYDIEGTKDPLYTSYTDPTSFMNGISITIPDTCKQTPKQNKTDISGIMQKYVVEAKLKDSAMILVVPSDDAGTFDEKTLQHLATNRDLVFGIIQSTQAPVVADDSSLALAATVTGGQIFGTINDDDSAQQITAYLLATLGPQKPVSVATVTNLAMGENIGYVNVDGRKDVTFEVTVTGMQNELVFLTIGDQEVSIVPDDIPSKNFNTTTIVVNKSGPISITVMNSQKTYNLYVRVWEVPDKAVNLVVDQSTDAGSGASVKTLLAFEEISKATVTFFDCNGLNSTISDTTQVAGVGPWNISQTRCGEEIDFVPFLCQSGQKNCLVPGSEDLYSYKVVTEHDEGSFQFWGSFMCPKPAITACQNGGTLGNGACKCKPEYTGPECQLPNCNGNGYLYFDDGPKCSCNDGFSGDFCDISECALNETISAALFDPTIRVLTVVMLYNDADDLKTLYENTKKTLPSKMTAEAIRNIFKYVFYAQNAEQKDVLSVGQSLDTTSIDIPKLLGNSSDEIAFEDVVSQALKVTGRQQRG
ncbi:hypothetical protein L596_000487 [Steinernema carpocapsae]|uniref:EGF-like domain-containing protein n=1 Tax=Steinernema carpocapsae TaxID=34508 RepID=A0A4U8UMH9_STECR|nr:hypothetical protein L596_000487 [Steinernema carpocapsae]